MNKRVFENRSITALAALLLSGSVLALTPPPPLPKDDLIAFYQALDGDNWDRNDGWLDPDTPICDWYGIRCQPNPQWGYTEIGALELPDNGLNGEINQAVRTMLTRVRAKADLSRNHISGLLTHFPAGPMVIDLSHNQLEGPLPPNPSGGVHIPIPPPPGPPSALQWLNLSGNQFSGAIPWSWTSLELAGLDLSDNALDADAAYAFVAMRRGAPAELNLAGNHFSGSLPEGVMAASLYLTDEPMSGGGLNLCFNNFEIEEGILSDWIDQHHVGGPGWQQCLNRDRQPVDPSLSGSWFAPGRAGEGIVMQLLNERQVLAYHFSFDTEGRQAWSFDLGQVEERHLSFPRLLETRGDFDQGLRHDQDEAAMIRQLGSLRLDRVGGERIHAERVLIDWSGCPPLQEENLPGGPVPLPCPIFPESDRHDLFQLSRLAGSRCEDGSHADQDLSGIWYNPERSGEGFLIEVIESGSALVYWFTFQPDGSGDQAWMIGQGPITSRTITIDSLLMPVGGRQGAAFDPDQIEYLDWGSLQLDFSSADQGQLSWQSLQPGFGAGDYPIERLARPMLADCSD